MFHFRAEYGELQFAKTCVNKDVAFWDQVIISDESTFNVFGSDLKKGEGGNTGNCQAWGVWDVLVWSCTSIKAEFYRRYYGLACAH